MKTLETARLILRNFSENDLHDFYAYASVPGVGEMAGWPHHTSIEVTREVLNSFLNHDEVYALVHKDTQKVIGSLGVHARNEHNANEREIGYVLSKDYWGQGYTPEAVNRVIQHLFNETSIDILTCAHFSHNNQSKRVIEKTGFTYSHTAKYTSKLLNTTFDSLRYTLTKTQAQRTKKN